MSKMVKFAKDLGDAHIEFSPEDAGRSDPEFLVDVVRRAHPPPAALSATGFSRRLRLTLAVSA